MLVKLPGESDQIRVNAHTFHCFKKGFLADFVKCLFPVECKQVYVVFPGCAFVTGFPFAKIYKSTYDVDGLLCAFSAPETILRFVVVFVDAVCDPF